MTATPVPRRSLPRWLPPVAFFVVIVGLAVAVIVLANNTGGSGAPPRPAPFENPVAPNAEAVFEVRDVAPDGTLSVASADGGDAFTATLVADAGVELLVEATPEIPGHWVTVIGVPNEVRNFSIRALLVMPEGSTAAADGFARTPGGFSGLEGSADANELLITSGFAELRGETLLLVGDSGEFGLDLSSGAPLFAIEPATAAAIRSGDRLVTHGDPLDEAGAVLVVRRAQ